MTSAPAIGFEIRPSRWLPRVLLLASALAVVAVWASAIPLVLKLGICGGLVFAFLRMRAQLSRLPVQAAGWARDGGWSLRMDEGEDVAATLAAFRVFGEKAIWLRLALPARRHVVLLLAPDNSDADIRRRLRMRLAQAEAAGHSGR